MSRFADVASLIAFLAAVAALVIFGRGSTAGLRGYWGAAFAAFGVAVFLGAPSTLDLAAQNSGTLAAVVVAGTVATMLGVYCLLAMIIRRHAATSPARRPLRRHAGLLVACLAGTAALLVPNTVGGDPGHDDGVMPWTMMAVLGIRIAYQGVVFALLARMALRVARAPESASSVAAGLRVMAGGAAAGLVHAGWMAIAVGSRVHSATSHAVHGVLFAACVSLLALGSTLTAWWPRVEEVGRRGRAGWTRWRLWLAWREVVGASTRLRLAGSGTMPQPLPRVSPVLAPLVGQLMQIYDSIRRIRGYADPRAAGWIADRAADAGVTDRPTVEVLVAAAEVGTALDALPGRVAVEATMPQDNGPEDMAVVPDRRLRSRRATDTPSTSVTPAIYAEARRLLTMARAMRCSLLVTEVRALAAEPAEPAEPADAGDAGDAGDDRVSVESSPLDGDHAERVGATTTDIAAHGDETWPATAAS